MHIISDTVQF